MLELLKEKEDKLPLKDKEKKRLLKEAAALGETNSNADESSGSEEEVELDGDKVRKSGRKKAKLTLAGLLNVLDGVVDSPGRILIMTTNHPEKLDPALIRPGRINKRLHLGHPAPRSCRFIRVPK